MKQIYPELASQLIAIDGKTLRGSAKNGDQQEHCLSAWAADAGVTLALEFIQDKSNEIPAFPKLLDQLEIKGHVISVDAMGTQVAGAKKVIDKGADYIMALKRNQSGLHDEVIGQFHFATTQIEMDKSKAWSLFEQIEKANGRVTTRRVAVTNQLEWMQTSIRERWANLSSLIMIETESYDVSKKETSIQKRYYISSLEATAEVFQGLIRKHWSIESGCHWVLDTLYREDHSQVRIKNAVRNLAIVRRMAHNLLKLDTSIKKSLPMKQMRAMASDSYREHLLSLAG
jgi:predicted transposase YbfD/YdcC